MFLFSGQFGPIKSSCFELQPIVDRTISCYNWYELLYRPSSNQAGMSVETFFKTLSTREKISLDLMLFQQLLLEMEYHPNIRFSFNLFPSTLASKNFISYFNQQLRRGAIDCHRLCIEIIEIEHLVQIPEPTIQSLRAFKANGGTIALDNFGSGHSLWQLIQLNLIKLIKVDRSQLLSNGFYTDLNKFSENFCSAVVYFCKALEISTVFEGVESNKDFEMAKDMGFDFFQGRLFNKKEGEG